MLQATCARTLESDVQVEVATADGAVRGTLVGTAMQVRAGTEEGSGLAAWDALVTAAAPLSKIEGRLRLDPQPGALGYLAELHVILWYSASAANGELSPHILIQTSDITGLDYGPIYGVFPPVGDLGKPVLDAGVRR